MHIRLMFAKSAFFGGRLCVNIVCTGGFRIKHTCRCSGNGFPSTSTACYFDLIKTFLQLMHLCRKVCHPPPTPTCSMNHGVKTKRRGRELDIIDMFHFVTVIKHFWGSNFFSKKIFDASLIVQGRVSFFVPSSKTQALSCQEN